MDCYTRVCKQVSALGESKICERFGQMNDCTQCEAIFGDYAQYKDISCIGFLMYYIATKHKLSTILEMLSSPDIETVILAIEILHNKYPKILKLKP